MAPAARRARQPGVGKVQEHAEDEQNTPIAAKVSATIVKVGSVM